MSTKNNKKIKKIVNTAVSVGMVSGVPLSNANVSFAADVSYGTMHFAYTNDKGVTYPTDDLDIDIKFFRDSEKTIPVNIDYKSYESTNYSEVEFLEDIDADEELFYKITVKKGKPQQVYEQEGSIAYSKLNNEDIIVKLDFDESAFINSGGIVYFRDEESSDFIDPKYITLYDNNNVYTTKTDTNYEYSVDFSDFDEGDKLNYKIDVPGYKVVKGEIIVGSFDDPILVSLSEKDNLDVTDISLNAIYGDKPIFIDELITNEGSYSGKVVFKKSNDENVVTVEDDKINIVGAGKTTVVAEFESDDNYNGKTVEIPVEIAKKNLGTLDYNAFEFNSLSKNYDSNNSATVVGTLKDEYGVLDGDNLPTITLDLSFTDSNVGLKNGKVDNVKIDVGDNYSLNFNKEVPVPYRINPYKVLISLKDQSIGYASPSWRAIAQKKYDDVFQVDDLFNYTLNNKNLINEFNDIDLAKAINLSFDNVEYNVGTYQNAISASVNSDYDFGNFSLELEDNNASLDVTATDLSATEVLNKIFIDNNTSSGVYVDDSNVYLSEGSILSLGVNDNDIYDSAKISLNGSDFVDTITIPSGLNDGEVNLYTYLYKKQSEDTKTKSKLVSNYNFVIDNSAPKVDFLDGIGKYAFISKKGVEFNNNEDLLKFTRINSKEGYNLNISVDDELSGVSDVKYSILPVNSNDDVKNKVLNSITNSEIFWKDLKSDKVSVPGTDEGYYVVLVKVTDNLGNVSVHSSNGTVIDTTNPVINVEGLSEDLYYNDIDYSISLIDPRNNGVSSGIEKLQVKVYNNGKLVSNSDKMINSFTLNANDIYGSDISDGDFDNFGDFSVADVLKTITPKLSLNSNNIDIEIIAIDSAGNTLTRKDIKGIKIDKSKPQLVGSFNNNNFKNEKYFNKSRVLSLSIKQRNFNEENLVFNISTNGNQGSYTVEDIRNGKVEGVSLIEDASDSQLGRDISELDDNREISYKIQFGDDNKETDIEYEIGAYYKYNNNEYDLVFNDNYATNTNFVIDNIKPTIELKSFNSNGVFDLSLDKNNPIYSRLPISNEISIKEKNFNPNGLVLNLESYDINGVSIPSLTDKELEGFKESSNWERDNDTNKYLLPELDTNANYMLKVDYMDLAGNKAEVSKSSYFTVDSIAPNASFNIFALGREFKYSELLEEKEKTSGVKKFLFDIFTNGGVDLVDKSFDNVSGIKSVKYYIDEAPKDAGENFDMNLLFDSFDWKDINSFNKIDLDKNFVIYERVEDNAGNIAYLSSKGGIVVDTQSPDAPQITINSDKVASNEDVNFNINVHDKNNDGKFSGIKSISYEVYNNKTKKVTQKDIIDVPNSRKLDFETSIKVLANEDNNSNDLVLRVNALDYAGNVSHSESDIFAIDITKPVVSARIENRIGLKDDLFYNRTKDVYVDFADRNFNPSLAILSLNINGNEHEFTMSDIENGLASEFGISLKSKKDNQNRKTSLNYDDRRVVSYAIAFGDDDKADFDYSNILFEMKDLADNVSNQAIIDDMNIIKIASKIDVEFSNSDGNIGDLSETSAKSPYYSDKNLSSKITILDRHFKPRNVDIKLTQIDNYGNPLSTYDLDMNSLSKRWTRSNYVNTLSLDDFDVDGRYILSINYRTRAGINSAEFSDRYFIVDKSLPIVESELGIDSKKIDYSEILNQSDIERGNKSISFDKFTKDDIAISDNSIDRISGIKSSEYYIEDVSNKNTDNFDVNLDFESMDFKDFSNPINITEDGAYILYQRVFDNAGNVSYGVSKGAFVLDSIKPNKSVIESTNGKKLDNKDLNISISAEDVFNDGKYSGIDFIEYEVINAKTQKKTQSGKFESEKLRAVGLEGAFDLKIDGNNSNDIIVKARAVDRSGNESNFEKSFAIDTSKPIIDAYMDKSDVQNQRYYNKSKEVKVKFNERNFDPKRSYLSVDIDGINHRFSMEDLKAGLASNYGISLVDSFDNQANVDFNKLSDARIVEFDIKFGDLKDADVDYDNISFDSYDLASNKSEEFNIDGFSIDKSIPSTGISFESDGSLLGDLKNTSKANPYYTNRNIVPIISIEDRRFNPRGVEILITQHDLSGRVLDSYTLNYKELSKKWIKNGNVNTLKLDEFKNDARYSISVKYKNKAGSDAPIISTRYFVVDKTAPNGNFVVNINGKDIPYSNIISENEFRDNYKRFSFDKFTKSSIYLKDKSFDDVSGIKSVKYYIDDVNPDAEEDFEMVMNLDDKEFLDLSKPFKIEPDRNIVIYEKIEDMSGNITYIFSKGGIAIDSTLPEKPTINVVDQYRDLYDSDIGLEIISSENNRSISTGKFSGIKNVYYEVYNGSLKSITQSGNFDINNSRVSKRINNIVIDSSKNNSNDINLRVVVSDYAGNNNEITKKYSIDTTKPVVKTRFDNAGIKNGKYYNITKFVDVDFIERNFNSKTSYLSLKVDGKSYRFSMDDLVSGKAKNLGIGVEKHLDTQKGISKSLLTDSRNNSYKISFGNNASADFEYSDISFSSVDQVGNQGNLSRVNDMVIDKVAPILNVGYYDNGYDVSSSISTRRDNPYYTNKSITPVLTIKERNFKSSDVRANLSQENYLGAKLNVYNSISDVYTKKWNNNGNTHSLELSPFIGDAIFGLSFDYEDLAGNKVSYYLPRYFAVDKTLPTGLINVNSSDNVSSYSSFSEVASFEHVSNNAISVNVEGSDDVTGIKSVDYYIYYPDSESRNNFKTLSLSQLHDLSWNRYNGPIQVNPDAQAIIYAKITDMSNNVTYINNNGAIIADRTSPLAPNINITSSTDSSQGVFNNDVGFNVHVEDVLNANTYAGLKNVLIEVLSDGVVTQSQNYNVGTKQARVKNFDSSFTVDSSLNNSNNVVIRVTATDNALNTSTYQTEVSIDITPPRIEVLYDINDPRNGKYYNNRRTATIRVYERNFDPSLVNLDIKGGNAQVGSWQIGSLSGISDDNVNTLTIVFDEDADYSFTFNLTDGAGNRAEYNQVDEFTIDQTLPTIDVVYDKSLVNGKYINEDRTATITINEHNFDPNEVDIKINASLDGKAITPPSISNWSSLGDKHVATVTFSDDGDYDFTIDYTDKAGNSAQTFEENGFTIDKTPVDISFKDIVDKSTNKDVVAPKVLFEDYNFDKSKTTLTLSGLKNKEQTIEYNYKDISNGGIFELFDLPHTKDVDDIYTLVAKSIDFAGNETIEEITFAVNRYGSIFFLDENSKKYVDKYYNNIEENLVVHEVNPDKVTDVSVVVTRDGISKKLDSQEFVIEDLTDVNGWNEYKYTIDKSNFAKEGVYKVVIQSTDAASNKQDNDFKEVPIEFIVDKTNPSAVITGIEDNNTYNNTSREIDINVSDNFSVAYAKLFVNGKEVVGLDGKKLHESNNVFSYTLNESDDWQNVKVEVLDSSGNSFVTEPVNVIISSNSWVRFINSKWLKYLLFGLSGLLLSLFFILFKRNKDDEENDEKANNNSN